MSWWQFWKGGKKEGEVGLGFTREQLAAIHREQQEMGKTGEQTIRTEGQESSGEQLLEYQKLQQLLGGINANTTTPQALRKPLTPSLVPTMGSSPVEGRKVNQGQGTGAVNATFSESVGSGNQAADDWVVSWVVKGFAQNISGNFEAAISFYNKALEIEPYDHVVLLFRGVALRNLGRNEEAISSYDRAIEIKSDYHEAWYSRGVALEHLGRNEEAITSYNKVIEIKPDYHEAWNNRGIALEHLGRNEEAIASYDKAIEIKVDYDEAWYSRGTALVNLGRYKEAIASYDRAIEIKVDYDKAWNNRGIALVSLVRYEEAITSFDKAIEIKPDLYEPWLMRGQVVGALKKNYKTASGRALIYSLQNPAIDQGGYSGEVANYSQGLEFCQQDTHPKGWGYLHWYLGRAHYRQGKNQEAPFRLFWEARREYDLALETLTEDAVPETYLEVMQDYLKVYRVLEPANLEGVGQIAYDCSELLQKLIKLNPSRKESLQRKFIGFGQITVDLMLQSGEVVQALEQVEKGKAVSLDWMLPPREPLTWTEMQNQRLDPAEALIYWYYSPLELHTILLLPQQAPQLIATTSVDALEKFLTTWNEQYSSYTCKGKASASLSQRDQRDGDLVPLSQQDEDGDRWLRELPNHLINLAEILSIEKILPLLSKHHIENLTLIPHRDLHRLPLHALGFPPQIKIHYLPTLHLMGGSLPKGDLRLLSIEAPDSTDLEAGKPLSSLSYAVIESEYICQNIGAPLQRIANAAATKAQVIHALAQGCQILHFTGHAGYNFANPKKSSLCLSKEDRLTIEDLVQIPLDGCALVCLSACETGITGKQTILDEYVGLVSAFLAQGVGCVVSTLWQVQSDASAIVMMEFYRQKTQNPTLDNLSALHQTTHWLRTATAHDLKNWCETIQAENPPRRVVRFLQAEISNLSTLESTDQPYSDPYYWAAYTITGS